MLLAQRRPDICIQDPRHDMFYFIPRSELARFINESPIMDGDVTFMDADDSLLDRLPDAAAVSGSTPDVVLRDADENIQYRMTFAELQEFRSERPESHPLARTFTMPMTEALVEVMPSAVRALLQTDISTIRRGS
jgi:hypothetical protein